MMAMKQVSRVSLAFVLPLLVILVVVLVNTSDVHSHGFERLTPKRIIKEAGPYQLGPLYCSDKEGFWCNGNCVSATPSYCCSLCYDPIKRKSFCMGCAIWA